MSTPPTTQAPTTQLLNKNWGLFGIICLLSAGFGFLTNELVLTDAVYYNSLSEQSTPEQIEAFLAMRARYAWIGYAITPLILALKMSFTAACLAVGAVLENRYEVKFTELFKVALICEIVFVFASVVQLGIALEFADVQNIQDVASMFSFSMLDFFGAGNLMSWAHYPLKALNLYELLYCGALGLVLTHKWQERFLNTFALAVASYGTGLVLWIAAVTFVYLQLS